MSENKSGYLDKWLSEVAQEFRDYEEIECVVFNEPRENAVARWVLRCLGNSMSDDTQAVIDGLLQRREYKKNQPQAEYKPVKSHDETIVCPGCESVQVATVDHTAPWYSYVHVCTECEYTIMESEWDCVEEDEAVPA